ncbi:RNA polymerase sigma factor [Kordiimonas sediminis]|uniref:RNA polymerase sigma factor n=1 Tax=Kordiimonas sediminis TaxID=1735581 RepID=A0A919E5F3_9PROT|nr:sigma-70 family RNA polymerase sigma factor [Kordiimonas sediminis]GHF15744.1 RNA polymerase sigma factor [Kordiimonas sediminis]
MLAVSFLKEDILKVESDEQLMQRVQAGDALAYDQLVRRHADRFRLLAIRTLGNTALAEDMVQECFVKLWTRPQSFDAEKSKFTTWFYRVVVNRCLDEKRRKSPAQMPEGFDKADDRVTADKAIENNQATAHIHKAVNSLKENQKLAVTLCYFDGLSNAEAAEIMGLKVKALESLLVRARAKLRDTIAKGRSEV